MDEVAKTELGRQALELAMLADVPHEDGLAQLQELLAQAKNSEEKQEISWAIEGFILRVPVIDREPANQHR